MKNRRSYFLVVLFLLIVSPRAHAAFPINRQTTTVNVAPPTDKRIATSASETFRERSAPINTDGSNDGPGYGIAALACGIAGLLVPLLGIPAITLGKIGLERRLRGLALAGLILGIIDLVIVAFAVIAVIAVYVV